MTINELCKELDNNKITLKFILNEIKRLKLNFVWHPLGFIMGSYIKEGNNQIRIHIWPENNSHAQLPYWNIHNHSFNLTSWVIRGEILNTEYLVSESNQGTNCIYSVNYDEGNSILKKTNKNVNIVKKITTTNKRGFKYSMHRSVFHSSIVNSNQIALTIVLSSLSNNQNPSVIGKNDGNNRYSYNRNIVDPLILNNFLKQLET